MRWIIFFLIGSGVMFQGNAQSSTDSLLRSLGYPDADSNAVLALYDAAYEIELTDPQRALELYRRGVAWSQSFEYANGIGKGYNYAGITWFNLGEIDSALTYARYSLPYLKKAGNRRGYAASLNNIGNAYNLKNDYPEAIRYYQEANAVFETLGAEENIVTNLNNIGNLLIRSNNNERAESYLLEALDRAEKIQFTEGLADVNNNLGSLEEARENYEKALSYCLASLHHNRKIGEANFIIQSENNIGNCYLYLGDYEQALLHLERGLGMLDTLELPREKADVLTTLSRVSNAQGEYATAVRYASQALPLAQSLGDLVSEKRLTEVLAEAYGQLDQPAEALPYYHRLQDLNRQLYDAERNRQLLELEQNYESEKKERLILEQLLQLERSKAEKRLLGIAIAVLALVALLLLLWFRYRLRVNQKLNAQQMELQTQRIRDMEQQQQILALDATLQGQEEERNRIARDLHDSLGGLMASVKMHLTALQKKMKDSSLRPLSSQTEKLVDQAATEVRRIAHNMTPAALMEEGLLAAVEDVAEGLRRGQGMQVSVQTIGDLRSLPNKSEILLYRILQELTQNIIKHARATRVIIQLNCRENELILLVEDNGQGFDPAQKHSGIGLKSIAARVQYLKGEMDIDAVPGEGTTVVITVPLPASEAPKSRNDQG